MKDDELSSTMTVIVAAVGFVAIIVIGIWQANVYSDCKMSGGTPVRGAIGFECIYQPSSEKR